MNSIDELVASKEIEQGSVDSDDSRWKLEEERYAARQRARRIKQLRADSLLDNKFREASFENFERTKSNTRQFEFCHRYAEHFAEMVKQNQGLLLYGNVGSGKTYLAACIANYLLDNEVSVVMTSFVQILRDAQNFSNDFDEWRFIRKPKLLIIDDLGAERSTDYALEKVYGIIDGRYRSKKPMILTTNLSLGQMQASTDIRYARIYDRIFEVCYPIEFQGRSFRTREAFRRYEKMTRFLEGKDEA